MSSNTESYEKDMTDDTQSMSEQTTAADAWTATSLRDDADDADIEAMLLFNNTDESRVEITVKMLYGTTVLNLDADDAQDFAQSVMSAATAAKDSQVDADDS